MTDHLTDPREMRKLLSRVAYRGDRIDGKDELNAVSGASSLARNVMHMAEAQGLSGEDAMTVLGYHALLQYERTLDMLLHEAQINPRPPMLIVEMDTIYAPTSGGTL